MCKPNVMEKMANAKKAIPIHFSRKHQNQEDLKSILEEFEQGYNANLDK